ncbi:MULTISPECIES: elongation factor P [Corallococcus]|uniref:Elongation factor P n=1 Tax=Corallococcus carmarthensis TaxID=2316728 RepID=A0A3A8KH68_9BACT|nr:MULTISPECIES: elongation factor P [Corallococcus]NBD11550.1 elongation factor P [Corallococcus silvisoli]NOK23313.1 elongation factor P [Corallococcus carmarthensis]RKH03551.1 elongation factor P [Corallococcus carmarthensis]TSC32251.1 elongation factor P [Corallococcus sp. Z5C101001]
MAGFVDTSEFRNGLKIEIDGEPFVIEYFQHVKPGKGSAFVRTKIRSLLSGRMLEPTMKSGDKVGIPDIEQKDMEYLYSSGDEYYFMEKKTFEQTFITEKVLGEAKNFLKENTPVEVLYWNGKAISVGLPNSVDLKVTKCDPGVRGDTVSGAMKPATMETGFTVNVPLFINEGDVLKIDTREGGKYLTRVATAG